MSGGEIPDHLNLDEQSPSTQLLLIQLWGVDEKTFRFEQADWPGAENLKIGDRLNNPQHQILAHSALGL